MFSFTLGTSRNAVACRRSLTSAIGLVIGKTTFFNLIIILISVVSIAGALPHKHKIVIAGNHELSFDPTFTNPLTTFGAGERHKNTGTSIIESIPTLGMPRDVIADAVKTTNVKDYLTNCIYLEDSEHVIDGIKIYGTPW